MPRLELYPFRFRDPLTRKWVRARYVAQWQEIAERYAEWEITGPPEIRDVDPDARYFNPFRYEYRTADAAIGNSGEIVIALRPTTRRCFVIVGTAA